MKQFYKLVIILIGLHFFQSCTDKVAIDLPDGGPRLVIEASMNWEKGTSGANQTIKLSQTTPYFSGERKVPVTGASVIVINETSGMQFTFQDQNNGDYTVTNFVPEFNQVYRLEIQHNGQTYAATESFVSTPDITKIVQEKEEAGGLGDDQILVKVFFDDPAQTQNFYLGEFIPSHKPVNGLQALNDRFSNGNENFLEYEDKDLKPGDQVAINLFGISRRYFDFINLLIIQSNGNGGPFQTTPVRLKGNCINVNSPNEEVLGYFRLSQVVRANYTIQ